MCSLSQWKAPVVVLLFVQIVDHLTLFESSLGFPEAYLVSVTLVIPKPDSSRFSYPKPTEWMKECPSTKFVTLVLDSFGLGYVSLFLEHS